ncbi:crotonase/enoyl-CoA hydratase family protein [Minwuia sp.]|uniref:crotonase/enoyl-CoA hydratase family protein n=1 Tax=Minwuia sp. TaxID=2493630 RepID=UPI003A93B51B
MTLTTLALSVDTGVAHLELNRPDALNAMNRPFWGEMIEAFDTIAADPSIRCVVISGRGRHFCAGLDLKDFTGLFESDDGDGSGGDPGRERERLRRTVLSMQETFSVIERCRVPVLAAIHGACIGGGVDLISACDCRYASRDAFVSIQEINIGIAADVGSLQRMPHLMPQGVVREMAFTGEKMAADRAMQYGLYNDVFDTREAMMDRVMEIARTIASKSPLAMTGTKEMLNYTRDHSVQDGLNYVATWNAAMLINPDVRAAIAAQLSRTEASFGDLWPADPILGSRAGKKSGTA